MISKRVAIDASNDNYARLAAYIADAGSRSRHDGEKALMSWCAGCLGGDDYTDGIAEAVDVQSRNTRAVSAKTYHLVVSFRPEDEARLTPEVFKAIEQHFSQALGYTDHQRHCGVHKNTGNLHMHIAYNMIHPEKYTRHKEFRDFWIRDKVCRELEREYGLTVDNGREQAAPDRQKTGEKAAIVEAHTGQQSFESYARMHRETILQSLEAATGWQDLHEALAVHGMEIKPHGNGLVVKDRHGNRSAHAIKASAMDRSLSLKKLEVRFGAYHPPQSLEYIQERSRYEATPLQRSPERGALFAEYRAGIELRKATLQAVKEREDAAMAVIRATWAAKRKELERMSLDKRKRRNLIQLARKHEAEALSKARLEFQQPREQLRREIPYTSWNAFLRHKAESGNEVALAVLRSRAETAEPEQEPAKPPAKDWSRHGTDYADKTATKAEYAEKERALLEREGLSDKTKKRLLAVLRMERVAAENGLPEMPCRVDGRGTVIFTLPSGGSIRDSGKELFFTAQDKAAEVAALLYAREKWGKDLEFSSNKIMKTTRLERTSPER